MTDETCGSLMSQTLVRLETDQRSLEVIARESGVPFYWLRAFRAGKSKDPSVNRVQKLYEHLTGTPLL